MQNGLEVLDVVANVPLMFDFAEIEPSLLQTGLGALVEQGNAGTLALPQ
jgi:hypothetical protein